MFSYSLPILYSIHDREIGLIQQKQISECLHIFQPPELGSFHYRDIAKLRLQDIWLCKVSS